IAEASSALAACPTLTTLQNGTTADATVVMSNFNIVRDCVNSLSSISSGAVVFSNGTTLTGQASNFFWDSTNSRLGLGLAGAAPASSLAIGGSASIGTDFNVATPPNGLLVEGNTYIGAAAPTLTGRLVVTGTPGNALVVADNNGNQIFIVKTNGSVGIGSA